MSNFLIVLPALGLVLVIGFSVLLVTLFVGWKYSYDSSTLREKVIIPKARRYSISIFRDLRFSGFRGMGNHFSSRPFSGTKSFSVLQVEKNEEIVFRNSGWGHRRKNAKITFPAGYFYAPAPGEYIVTTLIDASAFIPRDKIIIRKHARTWQIVGYSLGIAAGFMLFVSGSIMFFS